MPAGLELGPGEAEPPGRLGLVAAGPIERVGHHSLFQHGQRGRAVWPRGPRREPESSRHDDTGPVQGAAASAVMSFFFNPASWYQPSIDAVPVETNASMCG